MTRDRHQHIKSSGSHPRWQHSSDSVVSIDDLLHVSDREVSLSRQCIAQVKNLVAWREQAVKQGKLNPHLHCPGGGWRMDGPNNDILEAYHYISEGHPEALNLLRYYAPFFSGYKLIHFGPSRGLRAVTPVPDDPREVIRRNVQKEKSYLEFYLRLKPLLPHKLIVDPPWRLGEVGSNVGGVIVNRDTVRWQLSIATLWWTGILDHLIRQVADHGTAYVVEIGSGIGSLAYFLKSIIPQLTYVAIDLPESLLFSSLYLALTMPESRPTIQEPGAPPPATYGITLTPNFLFEDLVEQLPRIDLALNYISLGEMNANQVNYYASLLNRKMRDSGIVFEGNDPRSVEGAANESTRELFSHYFVHNEAVDWTGIPQTTFEEHEHHIATSVHANQPLETFMVRPNERLALPVDTDPLNPPPAVEPSAPSLIGQLWHKFRAQPLHRLPLRIHRKLNSLISKEQ